jgi:Domain of unknown function (DUF4170)
MRFLSTAAAAAQMRYFIVHPHRLLDPDRAGRAVR